MKQLPLLLLTCTFIFCILACQNSGSEADFKTMTMEQDLQPPTAPPQSQLNQPQTADEEAPEEIAIPRQIIRNARFRIQVKDIQESSRKAGLLAEQFGGYVSESESTNSSYQLSTTLTIRVPAARFDSLLEALGGEALFTQYKHITSQDVTEEYVDILTRLKTKKEVRDRYVDILRNKAKTVQDILQAEEQIRVVQEEIEAKEGRLRYLKNQVGMSTIYLEMYQQIEYQPEPDAYHRSFWSKLVSSLENGWELAQGIVLFLFNIWPLLILGGLIWWRRKWLWSKVRRNKQK